MITKTSLFGIWDFPKDLILKKGWLLGRSVSRYVHFVFPVSLFHLGSVWSLSVRSWQPVNATAELSSKCHSEVSIYWFQLLIVGKDSQAAAAAKSLQSCPTLSDPIDGSPPGSPVPGILQARTLEWVAISSSSAWKWKVKVKSLSRVQLLATPWTVAHQAPPSTGFSGQEYWSGVPLPIPKIHIHFLERNCFLKKEI